MYLLATGVLLAVAHQPERGTDVLLPRILRPLPAASIDESFCPRPGETPVSVLRAAPGSYAAEALAAVIERSARWPTCAWLRSDEPGPAALARALTEACLHRWPDAGQPAPAPGTEPVARLRAVLRRSPRNAVVVVELAGPVTLGVSRLLRELRPVLADRGTSLVVVTEHWWPPVLSESRMTLEAVGSTPGGLPDGPARALLRLAGGRAAVVRDVVDAAAARHVDDVTGALARSHGWRGLLDGLTADLLAKATPAERAALEVCVHVGYWHPRLVTEAVAPARLRPWVVPLEDGWGWLRPVWRRALDRALAGRDATGPPSPALGPVPPAADPHRRRAPEPREATLDARLLGPFELRIDGRPVRRWNGQRGSQVLRYLLARRRHACARDELLEEFWPDVARAAARNRLQVAVSGLRRALAEVTNLQVVEFAGGEYRINPAFRVEVDTERFERALAAGRRAQQRGDGEAAVATLQEAVDLYRGDFVPDAPYGQWTMLPRESLRLGYLDALDRISRIHLAAGDVDRCVATALRILDVDPCREDAHRLLMRCYAQQGRSYQALRQYELCCRTLASTLDTGPEAGTVRLYRAVRAGSTPELALTE